MWFWDSLGNELSYGLIAFIIGFALLFIFAFFASLSDSISYEISVRPQDKAQREVWRKAVLDIGKRNPTMLGLWLLGAGMILFFWTAAT